MLVATTGAAAAAPKPRFALSYDARASLGCPPAEQLRAAVAAELGYEPFADAAATTLSITVRPWHGGVRGRVEMRLADGRQVGRRDLTAASCDELTQALVLTVVMAIDPMRSGPAPKPRPQPAAPQAAAIAAPTRAVRERVHLFVAADAHVAIQSAPAPAFGLSADAGAAATHWSAALELRGDVPTSADVLGARVTASSLMAALVPCGRYGFAAVCAIVGGGAQSVGGAGFAYWVGYGAAGGRLELQLPVSRRWALLARIDGVATFVATEEPRQSWRTPIAVSVGVGVVVRPLRE